MQWQSSIEAEFGIFILHHGFMFNFSAFYILYWPITVERERERDLYINLTLLDVKDLVL